ncbi:sorting nexin-14-like isoform X2 [Danaus plexippus]|uniref:sorting nexin-14-like isoform X2 n=1 Tax=Danaus plexippus TaxID=13037 RepID=UPI002AAFF6ED|nr:sorting nexin-14-like isoform X2 [Danaus plexippus]
MTERCQKKFTEKILNQNYIIFTGGFVAFLAVLYFYRFHLITIIVSYVLGCLACYYGLQMNIFQTFLDTISCHFMRKLPSPDQKKTSVRICNACDAPNCSRHDPELLPDPWVGLLIHKQLDQAIEDFYNRILEQFINTWYSKITLQPFFIDELRQQLRYASACLYRRALTIDPGVFIFSRLLPCALRHVSLPPAATHTALSSRASELRYLRCLSDTLLPYLLRPADCHNEVFRTLVRELVSWWVLLPMVDVLADPYTLNTLLLLVTGDDTMAPLPTTPDYKVEFLECFVRQSECVYSSRPRLLRVQLEPLVQESGALYALLQYLKTTPHLQLLQFYQDIKSFQTRILNPELTVSEQASLQREAEELFSRYRSSGHHELIQEMEQLMKEGGVRRLQTSRALYQAARQAHGALEKTMLPKFLHSEEFYKLLIGPRLPVGYQKQMTKRPEDKQSMLKLGVRIKNALKQQVVDGQVLEMTSQLDEGESIENIDILQYLDSLAAEDSLDQDLSTYKVVLTHVESTLQAPPRRGPVRVFTLAVHRAGRSVGAMDVEAALWRVKRSEHDFHLLRAKLREFHGDALALQQLPSRRDNSPLETLRYKYEDFLQRLLQISLLQTSELLHLFLTVDGDFSLVVQASTLNASNTDLGNIYQSVAHKLRKEKGQHLESFLRNFLVSSDKERYQALKQGSQVEEAHEVNEEDTEKIVKRQHNVRSIQSSVFGNNFDIEPEVTHIQTDYQDTVVGFTQCFMYLLIKVLKVPGLVVGVVGSVLSLVSDSLDLAGSALTNKYLKELLNERRLAHLIRLGHNLLFNDRTPRSPASLVTSRARARVAGAGRGARLWSGVVQDVFDMMQVPRMNKQLVYNLLDLCVLELFPELRTPGASHADT